MKRTKRKNIIFSEKQWETVCKRAEFLKMKPATFIRNIALCEEWKYYPVDTLCFAIKRINHIGTDLDMIIRVTENTNSEYLEKLREFQKRYEKCRRLFFKHYSQLVNTY